MAIPSPIVARRGRGTAVGGGGGGGGGGDGRGADAAATVVGEADIEKTGTVEGSIGLSVNEREGGV